MLEAVVAVYSDWGIGRGGTQPVTVRADRKHFAQVTAGGAVIVGRRTLEDFPNGRPLKNRVNIVISRFLPELEGAVVVRTPKDALREAERYERAFVIGGASVYKALLPYMQRVYVTKLACAPPSDSFFPNLDEDPAWIVADPGEPAEENGVTYRFMVYERV